MQNLKKGETRHDDILRAAMTLFIEQGYINTTTQDIVDEANISRGLLYYHFKNKEDILYCLIEQYSDKLLKRIYRITYDKNRTAIEKLIAFIEATSISHQNITHEDMELQRTVDLEENRYMMDKLSHRLIEKLTIYFEHIIKQGQEEKVFSVKHPFETAEFLMTAYVFTSNKMTLEYLENKNQYLNAFKTLLERTLDITTSLND